MQCCLRELGEETARWMFHVDVYALEFAVGIDLDRADYSNLASFDLASTEASSVSQDMV